MHFYPKWYTERDWSASIMHLCAIQILLAKNQVFTDDYFLLVSAV